ncbi:MAG: hypothetical protein ACTTJS_01665 [Wolinella sp.]
MRKFERADGYFALLLVFDSLVLLWCANGLSISIYEAYVFKKANSIDGWLSHLFIPLLGTGNLAPKLPFILIHIANLILLYEISRHLLKRPNDALLSVAIFMLLPGVNASAVLIGSSGIVMFFALLVCYLHLRFGAIPLLLLVLLIFIDESFAVLFLALFFYAIRSRDNRLLLFSLLAFACSMYFWGVGISGKPRGYFLDALGIYALLFSPPLFIYFVYALYHILIKGEKPLLWYVVFSALLFSLLLSFRQKLDVEEYAPLVLVGLPLVLRVFLSGMRVRLPRFRRGYLAWFIFAIGVLVLNFFVFMFSKAFYPLMENPKEHFAYRFHIVGELASELKAREIDMIWTRDSALRARLACYGIASGGRLELKEGGSNSGESEIVIRYFGYEVGKYEIRTR